MAHVVSIERFVFSDFQENSYVLYTPEGEAVVIDLGCSHDGEWQQIDAFVQSHALQVVGLWNTHGHIDHVWGVPRGRREWKVPFSMHGADVPILSSLVQYAHMWNCDVEEVAPPEQELVHNQLLNVGEVKVQVLHTPGHTPGGVCFYVEDAGLLFSGDTLFAGSVGRSDLPGGNHSALFDSIERCLLTLPVETKVYSGHGPATTIGEELLHNPFLRRFR